MVFLRSTGDAESRPAMRGGGLRVRMPMSGDYAAWAALRGASRDHLVPWEPEWAPDELSRAAFRMRLRHYEREFQEQVGYAFFIFREADAALLGGLTMTNVRRGVTQSCSIGYWTGRIHVSRGYMTTAVRLCCNFAFDTLGLHRVEAACLPSNHASVRVLEKAGFIYEGYGRRYLKINGVWQDHLLFARLTDDAGTPRAPGRYPTAP
jgi:ribosomal-protein-alanine N-acetyltransferase